MQGPQTAFLVMNIYVNWDNYQPVDKVAQVVQQLRVILCRQVSPGENRILPFRTHVEEVEAPHITWDVRVLGHIAKHTYTTTL